MFEQQSFSDGPRNLFDEYVGMRLDVDNMSYEVISKTMKCLIRRFSHLHHSYVNLILPLQELLALGERIGNVNTGLSEDMISKCITAKAFGSSNDDDKSCAICLVRLSKLPNF